MTTTTTNTTTTTSAFEEAIAVTPLGSHTYSANLQEEWCIGTGIVCTKFYPFPFSFYMKFRSMTAKPHVQFLMADTQQPSSTV